ncbi:TRAP transporter large permease [Caenispirillum salinarum]|uniref:TRAP transporter large permease n=1 Tax=Caenispirillum salinarum TaxID=859058 RepID=UPI0038507927
MSELTLGLIVLVITIGLLMVGVPVAFALGGVAVGFLVVFEGFGMLDFVAESLFGYLNSFGLLAIPMFILMGAAVASSRAGGDLYEALDRWLYRVPGGLVISNLGACAIFSALSGSSPATCAAIGKMGIPEMRKRGYPASLATGSIAAGGTLGILIPPSVTMILYGIATESSIGRLFLAGLGPGLMLVLLFIAWSLFDAWRQGYKLTGADRVFTWKEKFTALPKVLPFLAIVIAVLFVLYGGVATPSEAAGVGALLCLLMAVIIYRMWKGAELWEVLRATMRESVMILLIIGTAELFAYMLSLLFITQSLAAWIADLDVNRWVLMACINVFLLIAGFFIPPAGVILMAMPVLLPIIVSAGFDPIWFAAVLTINMEIGLITPPVGLNLYVINGIAPDVNLGTILRGSIPYVGCMVLGIVLLCFFPEIATFLPDLVFGEQI